MLENGDAFHLQLANKANKERPNEYGIPFASGFAPRAGRPNKYCITQEKVVHGTLSCEKTDGTSISAGTTIATLPVGFRPAIGLYIPAVLHDANVTVSYSGYIYIGIDGIILLNLFSGVTGINKINTPFSFLAAQ